MKKMVIVLSTIAVIGLMMGFSCITVRAEEYSEYARKWLEKQREKQEKYMDELEADGNLTQEAIDSISKGTSKRKPNHKSGSRSNESNSSTGESSTSSGYSGPAEDGYTQWMSFTLSGFRQERTVIPNRAGMGT